jgi:metallo-beta-lactamase family protein
VEIFGEVCEVASEVGQLQGLSAHGDTDDLCRYLSSQDPEKVKAIFLVHGEYNVQQAFSARLEVKGFKSVQIPARHQSLEVVEEVKSKAA